VILKQLIKAAVVLACLGCIVLISWRAWEYFGHGRRHVAASIDVATGNIDLSPQQYSDSDAGQIYEALIPATARNSMLLLTVSVQPTICSPDESDMPDTQFRNALGAFRKMNDKKWDVSGLISSEQTITEAAVDSMFKSGVIGGWKQFRQQHPHASGYQAVSAVGFNAERTVAVVYSEVRCGAMCGTGSFTYFRRTPHGWSRVQAEMPSCRWIS
jgi:hypothetical protein